MLVGSAAATPRGRLPEAGWPVSSIPTASAGSGPRGSLAGWFASGGGALRISVPASRRFLAALEDQPLEQRRGEDHQEQHYADRRRLAIVDPFESAVVQVQHHRHERVHRGAIGPAGDERLVEELESADHAHGRDEEVTRTEQRERDPAE